MSSYGYVPWNKGSYSKPGSAASSTDRSGRNYGSLPRNYGNSRAEPERNVSEKPYTSRFARGYSTERTENAKAPEVRKYGGYNAPETPSLRVGSSSRFGGQIARSPISEKSPNVFGVSPVTEKSPTPFGAAKEAEMVTLVTRSTSPTPPCNSTFLRMKRAEMEPCTKCQVPKSSFRPYVVNGETQTEDPKKAIVQPRYRGYIKPEEKPPEEKKESRVGGLSLSRPTDLPLRQKPEPKPPLLSKSQTSVRLPPQIPNKDFRKSVLNMDPTKSKVESSSSESSSETSSDDSSEEDKPKPPPRDDSKTVIARTTTTPSPVKVTVKTLEAEPEKKFVLRKFDSGERAWWMSNKDIPNIDKPDEEKKKIKSSDEESKSWSKSISKTGSLSKTTSSASLSKSNKEERPKTLPLRKFDSTDESFASAGESLGSKSIQKSKSFARNDSKKSEESKIPLSRCTSGLQRTGSTLSDLTSDEELRKLTKTPSVKSITRTPSTASVTGKPPIKRSESKDHLEHTPGFNRIHKKLGSNTDVSSDGLWSPTRRMLVRVESGDRDWWLSDEEKAEQKKKMKKPSEKTWISSFTNIDHILGTEAPPPAAFRTPDNSSDDSDSCEDCFEVKPDQVKIHDSTAQVPVIQKGARKLDDTALQLCKDGDYGPYLDLDSSISEQQEEFEHLDSFSSNRKNSIVLRTQLSVRVHTIIEKLLKSEGKELRRALFSLKNIFQEDKDLVHAFVQNDGLATLIKVGTDADQNYQNYILRALGQVMLYVDGMNGVADHPATLQWLYNLTSSKFRLIVKTVLKLLIVFVEYAEANCILLVKAIKAVDYVHLSKPWSRIMSLMKGYDAADTEIFIYSMTLINKTLNGLPDQDLYYDQIDAIEEQGMESIVRLFTAKQGTDLDLLRQFQIYEAVLRHEDDDGEETNMLRQLDETIRKSVESRKKQALNTPDRRKSRRFSTSNSPIAFSLSPRALTAPPPPDDIYKLNAEGAGVTPGLRRRRERAERQKCFIQEQIQGKALKFFTAANERDNSSSDDSNNLDEKSDPEKDINLNKTEIKNNEEGGTNGVSDLNQKLNSPSDESKNPFGEMKGIISKAKEELAKSQMRGDAPRSPQGADILIRNQVPEIKKSETELHWDSLKENLDRELTLDDLDFTDLSVEEERDLFAPAGSGGGPPPPPPPINLPPSCPSFAPPPAPLPNTNTNKTKKTLKLFWKEVRDDPIIMAKLNNDKTLWDELSPVVIDTQKLEHLFESRAKDLITKKQQETNKNKEIIVLSPKRSNAINIGMTKLPSPRSIKASIMKMDSTIMNREGIEKLLTMLPTEEETSKIQEAQTANPDLPLGSAEQFLLTLASISELPARLKLWAFKLDYMNLEREIADPLMDLKQGMETLKSNKTFKAILGTLLSIGIFLNGSEVKGFQIDYLLKVPEVKDTVHKHTLLHHLCHFVMEKFPDSTDLYSEIGAVTRASKVDFEELAANIHKMEQECKASFDHLKVISKHDGTTNMKLKLSDFLADCAERIIVLDKIHRRVIHRFQKFCLWLGLPMHQAGITKPNDLCRVISEFSLEYRTTRERVLQQLERKANHRERNKTRGKMITEVGKFKSREDQQDEKLKELLRNSNINGDELSNSPLGTFLRRSRKDSTPVLAKNDANGNLTDGDDEILETLVKTATRSMTPRMTPRDRKRTGNANRKSLRRTLKNGLSEEDRQHLAAYKGY